MNMIRLKTQELLAAFLISFLAITSAPSLANSVQGVPKKDQLVIDKITDDYRELCVELQTQQGLRTGDVSDSLLEDISLSDDSIYQIQIDNSGKTATVVYSEFKCEGIDYEYRWCGTGGCGFYLIVDGILFDRNVAFRPKSIKIPTNTSENIAVIYPLHGFQCNTASGQPSSGPEPCYGMAIWSDQRQNFLTRDPYFMLNDLY